MQILDFRLKIEDSQIWLNWLNRRNRPNRLNRLNWLNRPKRGTRYFYLLIAATSILFFSCSSRYLFKTSHRIENYKLNFTERGIEPFDKANLSQQEWWESFYQHIVDIEASDLGQYLQFEHDTELDSLVALIAARGGQFYTDQFGMVKYLVFGNNSRPIADISYFRIATAQSLAASKRLEFLLEKGVEVPWKDIPDKLKKENASETGVRDQGTPWILYRFRISKLIDEQRELFNRGFSLSCDRYYCFTADDGTRRMLLVEGKKRYSDLVIPESEGYTIIQQVFRNAAQEYIAHYKCLK